MLWLLWWCNVLGREGNKGLARDQGTALSTYTSVIDFDENDANEGYNGIKNIAFYSCN